MTSLKPNNVSVETLADRLVQQIAHFPSVVVAFSGGVDSAVVAKAATLASNTTAYALTGTGPALGQVEYEAAVVTANAIGIELHEVDPNELADEDYVANAGRRCYFCKSSLYRAAEVFADKHGIAAILNGTNADDLGDYRPGLQAADEYKVISPLAELEIDKASVRQIAAHWNLEVADKPASPCLASRIAPGVKVTAERLSRIEAAEIFVRDTTGLVEFRVRLESGELARIEVPSNELVQAMQVLVENNVSEEFTKLGFRAVTLDLQGFRTGNLNALVELVTVLANTADGNGKTERALETR